MTLLVLGLTLTGNAGLWSAEDGTLSITAMDDWESPVTLRSYQSWGSSGLTVSFTDGTCRADQKTAGCAGATTVTAQWSDADARELALVQGDDGLLVTDGATHFQGGCNGGVFECHAGERPDVHCILASELDAGLAPDTASGILATELDGLRSWNLTLGEPQDWTVATRLVETGRAALDGAFDEVVICATYGAGDDTPVTTAWLPLRNVDRFLADPSDGAGVSGALGFAMDRTYDDE